MANEKPKKYEPPKKSDKAEPQEEKQTEQQNPAPPAEESQPVSEPAAPPVETSPLHQEEFEQTPWQAEQEQQFVEEARPTPVPQMNTVSWTAAEYIEHEKDPKWYGMFLGATIVVTGIVYILTKEIIASVLILVAGISVAFFASRPPSEKTYEISGDGIRVDHRTYDIEEFKSFSIVEEGHKDSIWLKPVKKFAPFLIIYFHQEDEQAIIDTLSVMLPHEPRELDNIDKFTRKMRF